MAAIVAEDDFKCIFLNENDSNFTNICSQEPVDNTPALARVMSWHRTGNGQLAELVLSQFTDANMQHGREMN